MNNPHFRMPKIWVVAADSARARIFAVDRPKGPLEEVEAHVNPEARIHESELTSDRPGRSHQRKGDARSAMDEPTPPKVHETRVFADQLAKRLDEARRNSEIERLYLIAAPAFLGELRKQLNDATEKLVAEALAKDVSHLDAKALRTHLPERIK